MDTENRLVVARSAGWGKRQDKWVKGIKKFKLSHRDVVYSIMTTLIMVHCIFES